MFRRRRLHAADTLFAFAVLGVTYLAVKYAQKLSARNMPRIATEFSQTFSSAVPTFITRVR
jgi:hypothetical protein